jgi:hypothetical protein
MLRLALGLVHNRAVAEEVVQVGRLGVLNGFDRSLRAASWSSHPPRT